MAGPANPFAGLAQKDGTKAPAGRGRGGSFSRATPYQSKSSNARGRGRGASSAMRSLRGHGRGAGPATNTWRKPDSNAAPAGAAASPFSQLKQSQPSSPFGGQAPQQKPAFSGMANGSSGAFGIPSGFAGSMVDSSRDPRLQFSSNGTKGVDGSAVPVEDMAVLNSYNDRYERLKLDRAKQREQAIRKGQMADPNQPTSLNQAITPVGTCTSMCPEFERVERIVQKMVDKSEKFLHPATNTLQNMETKMLKRFRRSAAGYDEQLPSDIRTPKALLQSTNYLIRHILGGSEPLGLIHKFVWDRTRSIRNDFSVQQLTQEEDVKIAVTCLERIARFHIVSLHLLSSPANEEPFDRHQEREQLNNTMLSLMYYYDDNRGRITFPNEDEFRAYYIIFSIHDQRPDLEARVQKWPAELRSSPRVQVALELFAAAGNTWEYQGTLDAKRPNAIAQGFYARFFNLVDSPAVSYLMACVAETYFNHMRQTAIRSIWKGYCRYPASQQHKNEEWTVDELTKVLHFDDDSQTIGFCEEQDLQFAENAHGDLYLNWGNRPVDSIAFQPTSEHSFSEQYVESKRAGRSMVAIILGLNIKEAATLGMIDSSFLPQRSLALPAPEPEAPTDDDALFVSDDDNEIRPPAIQTNGNVSQGGVFTESPASASSLRNAFTELSQSTTNAEAAPTQSNPSSSIAQATNITRTSEPAKTFSSLFSGTSSAGATTAPTVAPSNQFASISSPFTPFKTPVTEQKAPTLPTASSSQQPTSIFSTGTSNFTPGKPDTTPASATSQFKSPHLFQFSTTPTASPFGLSQTPSISRPDQAPGPTAAQPSTSIFDTGKPSSAPQISSSVFSLAGQNALPGKAEAEKPQPSLLKSAETTSAPSPFAQANNPFAPAKDDSPAAAHPVQSTNVFSFAKPVEIKAPEQKPADATESLKPPQEEEVPKQNAPADEPVPPRLEDVTEQQQPRPVFTNASSPEPVSVTSPPPAEPSTVGAVQGNFSARVSPEPAAKRDGNSALEDERRLAWLDTLKEAANKRRQTLSTSRKRILHEEDEQELKRSEPKAPKIAKPEAPTPRKVSMALSSIKPLPKLPILERIEAMAARKPAKEEKPEVPKPRQVDEDELLLSAARIAAESLRSGPRLLDHWSTHPEPRSSVFSPRSSLSSSHSFSRSQSPNSYQVNGYDVALAPDRDLGLGRTLSRTEQRIRLTGGKGLAYKPLNFTPEKKSRGTGKK
ncbi:hypothetical protein CNMCM8980_007047 [Aspergillus fumigatiaffinis]|uniref:SAC3/GANP/THP3 conserved domain-containing protein n=1 Tax=Aspergillus fumigatiaffinis TaxID=340414 RepID=A0A8H4H312_9EURO|nr:hypothetical protein CNMCM5878_007972 [Aspergillus fumigatiaffinis]KAF4234007.1 hypothetical protein CNMCM6457_004156 [Aspergillus fumigatiaffinis]KAF4236742.1 hypothetical protein CNMCM6805_007403 [Aspergillus fumigatiaffinis]KAF4247684.1 hypothetical protein CNMCM8980_007047 [Aspergillus fumigatiaffinis]